MRAHLVRNEVQRLLRQAPFSPFMMTLESGETATIEYPENIAFDPGDNGAGSADFYVISGPLRLYSTFEAVSSVSLLDEEAAPQ